jgi:hypothetical protein
MPVITYFARALCLPALVPATEGLLLPLRFFLGDRSVLRRLRVRQCLDGFVLLFRTQDIVHPGEIGQTRIR